MIGVISISGGRGGGGCVGEDGVDEEVRACQGVVQAGRNDWGGG